MRPIVVAPRDTVVDELTRAILTLGSERDSDSAEMALAMADALAVMAATLDRRDDRSTIDDRLDVLVKRIKQKYAAVRQLRASG